MSVPPGAQAVSCVSLASGLLGSESHSSCCVSGLRRLPSPRVPPQPSHSGGLREACCRTAFPGSLVGGSPCGQPDRPCLVLLCPDTMSTCVGRCSGVPPAARSGPVCAGGTPWDVWKSWASFTPRSWTLSVRPGPGVARETEAVLGPRWVRLGFSAGPFCGCFFQRWFWGHLGSLLAPFRGTWFPARVGPTVWSGAQPVCASHQGWEVGWSPPVTWHCPRCV